jgi:ATP-dependent Clp protease ATP-binding subunit ClpA
MFERFTDRARKIMALANQEAQRFNHEYVGTEHLLLGLVKEGSGVASNVLKNLEVDLRKVRLEVEKLKLDFNNMQVANTIQAQTIDNLNDEMKSMLARIEQTKKLHEDAQKQLEELTALMDDEKTLQRWEEQKTLNSTEINSVINDHNKCLVLNWGKVGKCVGGQWVGGSK